MVGFKMTCNIMWQLTFTTAMAKKHNCKVFCVLCYLVIHSCGVVPSLPWLPGVRQNQDPLETGWETTQRSCSVTGSQHTSVQWQAILKKKKIYHHRYVYLKHKHILSNQWWRNIYITIQFLKFSCAFIQTITNHKRPFIFIFHNLQCIYDQKTLWKKKYE